MMVKELVGKHVLDAVDFDTIKKEMGQSCYDAEECNRMRFRLDGVIYEAIEDPQDGYRSCLGDLCIGTGDMKNTFTPCEVVAAVVTSRESWAGSGSQAPQDYVEMTDVVTGKVVLSVGTTDIDDYYPGYMAIFDPKSMASNAGVQ